jgi:proteasome lid subunit RPN8/RPN11
LQRVLDLLWRGRSGYYLGEWHLHPAGDGTPSGIDVEQMKKIAQSAAYKCPEPVLLIVTGRLPATWGIRMFIYPAGLQVELEDVSVPGPSAT